MNDRQHTRTTQCQTLADRIAAIPHALTATDLARFLNVSRLMILRRAKRGTIPSFRIGSCVRFDPASISKWLVEMGVKGSSTRSVTAPDAANRR
jgi:excisionase family DNA binding protein